MNKRLLWLAGELVPAEESTINIMSPTCQYGINVFEGIRCYRSKDNELLAFRLKDHVNRLFQSAMILRLKVKYTEKEIYNALVQTIQANNYNEDIAVRIVFYIEAASSWAYTDECEMLIAPIPMGRSYEGKHGIACSVSSWERINDRSVSPRIKAGANYINSRMAQLEALQNGYDSAILLNKEGKVAEAPGSCIFIVRDNNLITPPITASVLESITRDTIIKIAREKMGLNVLERDIDRTELYVSDEIFLCGTAVEIVPVISVDKIFINNEKIGKVTLQLKEFYFEMVRGKQPLQQEWNFNID